MQRIVEQINARLAALAQPRLMIGLTGPPGSGKSTFAHQLAHPLGGLVLSLDGFHFRNDQLDARGLRPRKGSPPTFDVARFVMTLQALRKADQLVLAPVYSRVLHDPIPEAMHIQPEHRLIIVEGNYLLLDEGPWARVHPLLDEVWYLDTPLDVCMKRVHARHVLGGSTKAQADAKIEANDKPNAALIHATRPRADRIIELD
ncbi:MAG: AAA family ATPase [Planctomycetes bacterium]|nr:AAA family ATPase [Planctomycetota bacterium]